MVGLDSEQWQPCLAATFLALFLVLRIFEDHGSDGRRIGCTGFELRAVVGFQHMQTFVKIQNDGPQPTEHCAGGALCPVWVGRV